MAMLIRRMFMRLRNDFQLSIITLMGLIGVLGISPYAVYRLHQGNLLVGIADSVIVLSTMAAVFYAWRSGNTEKPGMFMSAVFTVGSTLVERNVICGKCAVFSHSSPRSWALKSCVCGSG